MDRLCPGKKTAAQSSPGIEQPSCTNSPLCILLAVGQLQFHYGDTTQNCVFDNFPKKQLILLYLYFSIYIENSKCKNIIVKTNQFSRNDHDSRSKGKMAGFN
jgi:hypothetical protein